MADSNEYKVLKGQPGYQIKFLSSPADIVIGGGAAGAGKTYGLQIEALRHCPVPQWTVVIFRRTTKQISATGGLWDKTEELYSNLHPSIRPKSNKSKLTFKFPSSAQIQFAHLQHEKDKFSWQGPEIGMIGFDELTHFTETQFLYLLSRNRSITGIRPYVRCTTNPQGQGWVKDLIQWFLYPDDYEIASLRALPIPERMGKIRYWAKFRGKNITGDTQEEVLEQLPEEVAAQYPKGAMKTITFIGGTLDDNKILTEKDPGYKLNLLAQDEEEQEQLLGGRWLGMTDDPLRLFNDYDALKCIYENTFVPEGLPALTADIAHEGSDLFLIGIWSGLRLKYIYKYDKIMGPDVIRTIKNLCTKHKVRANRCVIDTGGIGNYLKGFFRNAKAFDGQAKPVPIEGKEQRYYNLRAQCYYQTKDLVNEYEFQIDVYDKDLEERLITELWETKKEERNDLRSKILKKTEIKKIIGHSPDYADMVMMRSYLYILDSNKKKSKGRRRSRSG